MSPRGAAAAAGPRSERRVPLGCDRGCGDSDRSATRCIVSSGVPRSLSYAFACGRWWRDFFYFCTAGGEIPRFSQLETCEVFTADPLGAVSSRRASSFPSGCRCHLRPLHPRRAGRCRPRSSLPSALPGRALPWPFSRKNTKGPLLFLARLSSWQIQTHRCRIQRCAESPTVSVAPPCSSSSGSASPARARHRSVPGALLLQLPGLQTR